MVDFEIGLDQTIWDCCFSLFRKGQGISCL